MSYTGVRQAPRTRRRHTTTRAFLVGVGLAGLLTGCSSIEPDSAAATGAVTGFFAALDAGDGDAACAMLNDSAREAVEDTTGTGCAEGILTLGVDTASPASSVEVYSRAAYAQTGDTAVFLTVGDDGWLIRAAGCTPVEDAPFDCVLDGS